MAKPRKARLQVIRFYVPDSHVRPKKVRRKKKGKLIRFRRKVS